MWLQSVAEAQDLDDVYLLDDLFMCEDISIDRGKQIHQQMTSDGATVARSDGRGRDGQSVLSMIIFRVRQY
jgi:hypothetical protein